MNASQAAPEAASPELERFRIHSRIEIIAILRALCARRATVTLYFSGGDEFIVSRVLAVNPEFEELALDPSGDEAANRRIARSQRITLEAFLDHVKIQFAAPRAEPASWNGLAAIRVPIPDSLLRLQRRDCYRIAPPLVCSVPDPEHAGRAYELRILDLSCGGMAMLAAAERPRLEVGKVIEGCSVRMPGTGEVRFAAEVRNVAPLKRPGGGTRCGLRFLDLPPRSVTLIQRYITQLERARRALA